MSQPLMEENCKEQCRNREYQVATQDCKNKTNESRDKESRSRPEQ